MSNDYTEKFEKLVREEQDEARKRDEFERKKLKVAKKLHSQIKEVCKEFARIKGWKCKCTGAEYFEIINHKSSSDSLPRISVSVLGHFYNSPRSIYINIDCSWNSRSERTISPEEFTKSRLADAIIEAYKA